MTQIKSEPNKSISAIGEDEFRLSFKLNSIIMLVGPDGSGKTQFVMEQLMLQLKMAQTGKKNIKVGYINLDSIYAEILDNPQFSREHFETKQLSGEAHSILYSKLRALTSYPVNFDFVIVDSLGFDSDFRAEILKIGDDNHYNISALVFNYLDKSQYYIITNYQTGEKQRPPHDQMKQLKQAVSGGILKKEYESYQIIQYRDFDKYQISVEDYSLYDQYILPEDREYIIIGDIHGCSNELMLLLFKNGFDIDRNLKITHPEGKCAILVGDIIDKGYDIPGVIKFIYNNLDILYMVMGNHESLVYKKLSGSLKKGGLPPSDVVGEFFNTIDMLSDPQKPVSPREPAVLADEHVINTYKELIFEYDKQLELYNAIPIEEFENRKSLREKFFKIAEAMKSFYVHKDFIVTHSPCEKKFLGKITPAALKATRDFRYPKLRDYKSFSEFMYEFDEKIKFLKEESSDLHPIHVFGHVMSKEMSRYKNKINIDTGCAAGGKLTSIQIDSNRNITSEQVGAGLDESDKKQLHNFF
jgi:hypothetical protein